MKRLLALTILLLSAVFIGNAYAPDIQKFKVCINVLAGEKSKADGKFIERNIKSELGDLGDIDIVEDILDDWEFIITIHVTAAKYNNVPYVLIATYHTRQIDKSRLKDAESFDRGASPVYLSIPNAALVPRKDLITWCKLETHDFSKHTLSFSRLLRGIKK